MSTSVNTVLARCMVDPDFLALLASDRDAALRAYDLDGTTRADFAALDVRKVIGLATVITKVQSNGVWQWLPCTRALTARYGIDHELFAAFGREHQDLRSRPKTRDEQMARFVAFLRAAFAEWVPLDLPALRDVFQHEALTWEVLVGIRSSEDLTPILRVGFFETRAAEVMTRIREGRFVPEEVEAAPHWLVYQGDPRENTIRTAEIDERAAKVLACVAEGWSSPAAIARRTGFPRAEVNGILEAARDAGLVRSHARRLRR